MSSSSYVSCIKIGGVPILPPLMTPRIREESHDYRQKAIEIEKRKERNVLFEKCMKDLERLEVETKKLSQTSIEHQLTFNEDISSSPVPYNTYKKLKNLTSETIDVSEYSDEGVKLITKSSETEHKTPPPKLIRSNSYTLDSPSPILLAHLEKEARKCVKLEDDSQSQSPVTIIDNEMEPPLQVDETVISVEEVVVKTPLKNRENIEPELLEILDKLPEEHARNILEILAKQQQDHKDIKEQFNNEDKSMSVSISSQSLYYSVHSSTDTLQPSPDLKIINLKNIKNGLDKNKAAVIIQAHVRGYLVRRLISTEKVQSLIETIKDALLCAIQLHGAEVIEEADVELHRRLIQQVSAACYAFHDIFFTLSLKEQMGIIALDRQRKKQKAQRPLSASNSSISLSSRRSSARLIR